MSDSYRDKRKYFSNPLIDPGKLEEYVRKVMKLGKERKAIYANMDTLRVILEKLQGKTVKLPPLSTEGMREPFPCILEDPVTKELTVTLLTYEERNQEVEKRLRAKKSQKQLPEKNFVEPYLCPACQEIIESDHTCLRPALDQTRMP